MAMASIRRRTRAKQAALAFGKAEAKSSAIIITVQTDSLTHSLTRSKIAFSSSVNGNGF
jgi:hypothetical protein